MTHTLFVAQDVLDNGLDFYELCSDHCWVKLLYRVIMSWNVCLI